MRIKAHAFPAKRVNSPPRRESHNLGIAVIVTRILCRIDPWYGLRRAKPWGVTDVDGVPGVGNIETETDLNSNSPLQAAEMNLTTRISHQNAL